MTNNLGDSIKEALGQNVNVEPGDFVAMSASQPLVSGATSVAIGVSGADGAATNFTPATTYKQIEPHAIQYVLGGTFASDQITVTATVTYNDNTTATYAPAAFTATGTTTKGIVDFGSSLWANGKYITNIAVTAHTQQGSTTVTLTVNIIGASKV